MNDYFLSTLRLAFRHWTEADLPLAVALWGDADVMGYMGGPVAADVAHQRLQLQMQHQLEHNYQYWPMFVRATGAFAGCAGLRPYRDDAAVLEAGVHLARACWSDRYGEEAARAVITFGFQMLGIAQVVVRHHPQNANSRALVQRLGFRYSHDEFWAMGGFAAATYFVSRDEWLQGRQGE